MIRSSHRPIWKTVGAALASASLIFGAAAHGAPTDVMAAGLDQGPTAGAAPASNLAWTTVVNSNDLMPPLLVRTFNSFNQPSVNVDGMVVVRARSRGGSSLGPATHGIYTRDMAVGGPIVGVLDRTTPVPYPNNLDAVFGETPSFPRIDMTSDTIATRANHQPVWSYLDGSETRAGTTGIYANPYGSLITGVAKIGAVPEFSFLEVPGMPGVAFEVFPGAPAVTRGDTIVFKGNFTADGLGRTGVYYRRLVDEPAGGTSPVVAIADTITTSIPGTGIVFGSLAPPSAVGDRVVFAGFDDEANPTVGGIYLASLQPASTLDTLVRIGERIPGGGANDTFAHLGEGVAFDGRFVAFWGAWGSATKTVRLDCPTEGDQNRIDYCNQQLMCTDTPLGAPGVTCDETGCYTEVQVPVHQGIFVVDVDTHKVRRVAATGDQFDDFLAWNFSGTTPCVGSGHAGEGADDGEPARWRASAFVAVSGGPGASYRVAFKARSRDIGTGAIDGIYLRRGPGEGLPTETVLDTTTAGQLLDPEAPFGSTVLELGVERDGLRRDWLALSAKIGVTGGEDADGVAGVYVTRIGG